MTKYFAICSNGDKVTRTSKSRTYTHCVVARRNYAAYLASAERVGPAACASNFEYYLGYLDGTSRFLSRPHYRTEEEHAKQVAYDIARAEKALEGTRTLGDYTALVRAAGFAKITQQKADGYFDRFEAVGWCGRPDLAQKLFASTRNEEWYTDVDILVAQSL